jgi:hypothetical protein
MEKEQGARSDPESASASSLGDALEQIDLGILALANSLRVALDEEEDLSISGGGDAPSPHGADAAQRRSQELRLRLGNLLMLRYGLIRQHASENATAGARQILALVDTQLRFPRDRAGDALH